MLFQFHKGTIRTLRPALPVRGLRHFNSIKVQLEPKPQAVNALKRLFQFHKGTIRTTYEKH